jgi:hypothetical protein
MSEVEVINPRSVAKTNGTKIELLVKAFYPESEYDFSGIIDFKINNRFTEVKSCELRVNDGKNKRNGRFKFFQEQHNALIDVQGDYILLVHENLEPIHFTRIKASALSSFFKTKSKDVCISWPTAFREGLKHASR